jgi:hypothetical protein
MLESILRPMRPAGISALSIASWVRERREVGVEEEEEDDQVWAGDAVEGGKDEHEGDGEGEGVVGGEIGGRFGQTRA